jgi:hypothetical protein
VTRWVNTLDTDGYQRKNNKHVPRYEENVSSRRGYVEEQWNNSSVQCELLLLQLHKQTYPISLPTDQKLFCVRFSVSSYEIN